MTIAMVRSSLSPLSIHDDRLLYDNVQQRRSREASGEPGQDSEPGYDLVSPIVIIILVFIISDSEPG